MAATRSRRSTTPVVVFWGPTWSPDNRWLALNGSGGVFILDPATLELRRVGTGDGAGWSADGRSLAYVTPTASGTGRIEIVAIDSGTVRDVQPTLGAAPHSAFLWNGRRTDDGS